ncbi:tryptophan synthase subunit alpha [Thalassotalea ponticola]|uniref:tryptophan synthase subunit alpha n=1 Tax=Thalassotalea ponticola TaxID=1523392 RepID=UPI0025B58521|nr:tryptophan synthase subunit alpha [Thalassotalea ponticola]MDN3653195.1 tryptophan synthase subunit alpha [Thalassotalea ponticola]
MTQPHKLGYRYRELFAQLEQKRQGAFIPFVTIGDPNKEQSIEIIKTLIDNGADALELGIPYSDPSADGLTIQRATSRALTANVNTDVCLDILATIRRYNADIPIGLLLYANIVFARGIDRFYQQVNAAGVDSVLIADVPMREAARFKQAAERHGIAPIFIAPPNASEHTLKQVAAQSVGYTYVLARAGVTGTNVEAEQCSSSLLSALAELSAAPPVLGFGISSPTQVQNAIASGARGAISGSAVVNIIADNLDNQQLMLSKLADFTKAMKQATDISAM